MTTVLGVGPWFAKCKHKQAQAQKAKQEALIQMGTVLFDKVVN